MASRDYMSQKLLEAEFLTIFSDIPLQDLSIVAKQLYPFASTPFWHKTLMIPSPLEPGN